MIENETPEYTTIKVRPKTHQYLKVEAAKQTVSMLDMVEAWAELWRGRKGDGIQKKENGASAPD